MTEPRRRGLGRGLDALLGGPLPPLPEIASNAGTTAIDPDAPALLEIDPAQILPNPEQPRHHFDESALTALVNSIRIHGVLHPIVVERLGDTGYQLVAGERRWRAAQRAGVALIPAIVRPAAESARHALELALTENLVRTDLTPMEEASAYSRLADAFGLTHEAISLRVGRSRPQVTNTIRLLNLPAPIQQAVAEGRITAGHARALLGLVDERAQEALAAEIEKRGMSVRETERAVALRLEPQDAAPRRVKVNLTADEEALRSGMERAISLPVKLEKKGRGHRVIIDFPADEDLDAFYVRIGGEKL